MKSSKAFKCSSKSFTLTPLMMALAMALPAQSFAAETTDTSDLNQQQDLQTHHFHRDHVLGTSLDVVVTGVSKQEAKQALTAIEEEIARLDQKLSIWRADSEISALNQQGTKKVSPELFEMVAACEQWRNKTCGAFDARLGQLIQYWEQAQSILQPDEQTRVAITNQLEPDTVELNAAVQSIHLKKGVQLAPDAYAKGYIIDRALIAAREKVPALEGLLVDIGGDMRVWGRAPGKSQAESANQLHWNVGIQDAFEHHDLAVPSQILNLKNHAVAFSGKGYRDVNGQSHLLDPHTGMPLQQVEQCVVVGQCAADADALATALAAMGPAEGMELIESIVGYEAYMTLRNGQTYQSNGWANLVQLPQQADVIQVASTSSAKWPTGYQAMIDLTIPKLDVDKYRAPYVSVWVTDEHKKLVRTLAVWGKDEKWIGSNYVWWRRYGRMMEKLDAVAKPSRQPGHYKMAWDGKDDHGKVVPAGKYIVHIETSREHGQHSYQTMELTVANKPSTHHLPAQTEIGAVNLHFQKAR